jgi:pimeloyl-ACP methyl ester carboxylesterase
MISFCYLIYKKMNAVNPDIESGFVHVNDATLYYEKAGNGKPVVFVHGFGLDRRTWNAQFPELADRFQLIRYDARGFGRSALPRGTPYSHHKDLSILLQHLGISNACFIGHSMGGRIVQDFALTYPESCAALILVDPALHGYSFKTFSLDKSVIAAKETGIQKANEEYFNNELFTSARNNKTVSNALKEIILDYTGWHWLNKNPWTPLDPPSINQLYKIKQPTLVTIGQFDLPDFHDIANILAEQIPDSKKTIIPDAGHMCNMENPALFNQLVAEFAHS